MKYGEVFTAELVNRITGKRFPCVLVYRCARWGEYHTDRCGDGLWFRDEQIEGTCQFTVRGCKTEKSAKDKIRRYVRAQEVTSYEL